jgi:GTP cyclohydrolase II
VLSQFPAYFFEGTQLKYGKEIAGGLILFSYVDKSIRGRLETEGRLVTVDNTGRPVDPMGSDKPFLSILGPIPIPRTIRGRELIFDWYPFVKRVELGNVLGAANDVEKGGGESFRELIQANMSVNSVLTSPGFLESEAPLVRVHSCCMTGDVFGSMRCECGPQLETSFEEIAKSDGGAIVYMSGHEGRGIGLWAKAVTYLLQDSGQDTYQANVSLGLPEDSRDFTDAAVVLRYLLKGKPIRLLSNNPLKREHLESNGQLVKETVNLVTGVCEHNKKYLRAKRAKGHSLPEI